jgi:CelD/BcsL family acetyltransferase involved in cellulose biosynthesis
MKRSIAVPSGVQYAFIRTTTELESFGREWTSLWCSDPRATPFQRPEWLLPWWHQFGQLDLRAITIRENQRLLGFLPFYVYPNPVTDERELLLIGAGPTDYLDGVFSPDCTSRHVQTALETLRAESGWDVLSVFQLRPASLLFQALQLHVDARPADGEVEQFQSESCSRMPAVHINQLPAKIRRSVMNSRNRALRQGDLQLRCATSSDWHWTFEVLRRLHTADWQRRGKAGVLADPRVLAWHREALPLLDRAGMLRLYSLRLNKEVIGVLYCLIDPIQKPDRTQYCYLTSYSVDHTRLGPGSVLLALSIDQAADEGVETIDFLRGNEAYKETWEVEPVATYGFRLPHDGAIQCAMQESTPKSWIPHTTA